MLNWCSRRNTRKSNPSIDVQTAACGRFIVYQTIALEMPGQLRHKQGIFLTDADVDDEIYRKAVADVAAADRVGGGGAVPGGANSLGGRPPERWISDNSEYRLSIGKITHSWSQPDQIALEDVQLARNGQPQALVANRVDLGLSLRQITEPRYFHSVTLRDGTLNVQPQAAALPVQPTCCS